MFPALLISLKFLKVKQAEVKRKLTNNSEPRVLEKFQFYKKNLPGQHILIKINKKSDLRVKCEREEGILDAGPIGTQRADSRDFTQS